jgi:hypothetical protein
MIVSLKRSFHADYYISLGRSNVAKFERQTSDFEVVGSSIHSVISHA